MAEQLPTMHHEWTVAVRWLPWRPKRRRRFAEWAGGAVAPAEVAGYWMLLNPVLYIVIVVGLVILLVGVLVTVAAWIAALAGIAAAVAARLVLRQPFLVEATNPSGNWSGWWVVGWRRARGIRDEIDAALRDGVHPSNIRPVNAVAHPSE